MLFNLTEAEITKNWLANEPVRVSICCITYKQERYISQAIDSFLMQKTTFPFEIIIGEDCGGDSTSTILAEYQAEYPTLIKVIASDSNVGANANLLRVAHAAKGEYIAICEGDDFWIDEQKIQMQYSSLEENKNVDICFTSAKKVTNNGEMFFFAKHSDDVKLFTISEVIRGGGDFMPTASIMLRRSVIKKVPGWFVTAPVGDFYLQVFGALNGGAIYLPIPSVAYRVDASGSWSLARKCLSKNSIALSLNGFLLCADRLESCGVNLADVEHIKAMHETNAAIEFLRNGYYLEARKMIVKSWATKQWVNKVQVFIYLFRFTPKLSSLVIKFKLKH
ncbi:hypothetical protein KAM481_15070 [Aeromonas caviae]|uniref:glycosyltransferase n=1 Tax=Aeromonas caviae TaxID=648 RepID=UPI001FB9F81A|nr:glycosyltransferase [Aeromonas caviae]BDO07876.1 hypothetical protein KAM643c_14490 [Aeromonas caviae]GKR78037.1 hypothetical protein KAM481_15070 [Aeromonas caviae]